MSLSNAPVDNTKPVVRDKNPHNYRKVGYSMIVISVSLVLIALLVWAIGDNYHFASNIMAAQEVDALTTKQGYNIVSFDYTQPIGAKLKLLDHANTIDDAKKLQNQYKSAQNLEILILGNSQDDNVNVMAHAEVAALTPPRGYNVILFNHALPVGAKLTMGKYDDLLANATEYKQLQEEQIKDKDVTVIIFSSSYADNLSLVGVSDSTFVSEAFTPDNQHLVKTESSPVHNAQAVMITNSTSLGMNRTISINETVGINASNPAK